jgi:hypothetical protein
MSPREGSQGCVVVSGIMFFNPVAGVVYQALHYLRGLRDLGYDVYYVEDTDWWSLDPLTGDFSADPSASIALVAPILEANGFGDRWAYRRAHAPDEPRGCWGLDEGAVLALYRAADAWLNVTGSQRVWDEIGACRRRILVESDPISAQIDVANGVRSTIRHLDAHDTHFTFGETLGGPECRVPLGPYRWLPTRQPVDVALWASHEPPGHRRFTTVTSWHDDNKDRELDGMRYRWTKDAEFMKVLGLPHDRPGRFELAVTGRVERDRETLEDAGWRLGDALLLSADCARYQAFIKGSWGEFTVAREQYTKPRTGWFSDRSACYLAAGRPVITQETGFSDVLPVGRGLYAWTTSDDVLAAVDDIDSDPEAAQEAAREIAREHFSADRVLADLMKGADL